MIMEFFKVVKAYSPADVANVEHVKVVDETSEFNSFLKSNKLEMSYTSLELYLKDKPVTGEHLVFTVDKGRDNKVKTPVKFEKVERVPGAKKFVKKFVWVDADTNKILHVCESVKQSEAKKEGTELFMNGYRGTAVMRVMKLTENDEIAKAVYKTNKTAELGTYIVVKH